MPTTKPVALHKLQGTARGDRHGTAASPPVRTVLRMPGGLSPDGQRFWRRYYRILSEKGVLTEGDQAGLETMAIHYSIMLSAAADVQDRGHLVEGDGRGPVKNPSLQIMRDQSAALYRWCLAYGLTPVSRGRAGNSGADGLVETEFEAYLRRGAERRATKTD